MFNFMGKKEKKSRKGLSTSFATNGDEIVESNLEEVRTLRLSYQRSLHFITHHRYAELHSLLCVN